MSVCRAMDAVVLDPNDPAYLVLPSLLQYLTVDDILEWRLTSRHTSSPRVLIEHLCEMGRLDESQSILDFAKTVSLASKCPNGFNAAASGFDVEQVKLFEIRWWCMKLASARKTHFAESDVRHIVGSNLRSLLVQCWSEDASVRNSAHSIVLKYGSDGLLFVKQLIAEAMLGLMENLLTESAENAEISEWASIQVMVCTQHLVNVVRVLEKPQRQQWESLLVRVLRDQKFYNPKLIRSLRLLLERSKALPEGFLKDRQSHAARSF